MCAFAANVRARWCHGDRHGTTFSAGLFMARHETCFAYGSVLTIYSLMVRFPIHALACLSLFALSSMSRAEPTVEDQKILALLEPAGGCGLKDERELQELERKQQTLTAMGEKIYPVLVQALLDPVQEYQAFPIVEIIVQSKGDIALKRATLRKLFATLAPGNPDKPHRKQQPDLFGNGNPATKEKKQYEEHIRCAVIHGLVMIGSKEDLPLLYGALASESNSERYACLDALAKMGDENSIVAIKVWQKEREKLDPEAERYLNEKVTAAIEAIAVRKGK